jgi:hypothetical protein
VTYPDTKKPSLAPAIGYTQAVNYNWWLYEDETTPELIWPQSISVFDQMRRTDSQVKSVLRAVTYPLRRTPWRIDPNGARDEVVEFVAHDLGLPIVGADPKPYLRTKDRFSWDEHLRLALLMLPLGHSFFEQEYRVDEDGKRAHLRRLGQRPSKTIERIEVASDGGLVYIKQWWTPTNREPKPIPVNRLVAYVLDREGGNWLGESLLRSCYKNSLLKDRLLRVWAQTIERNGMGVPLYTAAETEESLTGGLNMAKSWRSGETAGSAVPFGAKLELVGVGGSLPDSEPAVRYHDEQIARGVLAHFLNLGTQSGSWALGSTFADFFTLSLQTVAQQIADTATCHVVEDLVDVNWGPDEPAPKIVFDEIGSRPDAAALSSLIQAGAIVTDATLEAALRQQFGLPPAKPEGIRPGPDGSVAVDPYVEQFSQSVAASAAPDPKDEDEDLTDEEWDEVDALVGALAEVTGQVLAGRDAGGRLHQNAGTGKGGQFTSSLQAGVVTALKKWLRGEGSAHPLTRPDDGSKPFTSRQLRSAIKARGLPDPPPRTSAVLMERTLLEHARDGHVGGKTDVPTAPGATKGHQRFTITHNGQRIDVGIFGVESTGKLSIYRENDHGVRQGRAIKSFDDMAGLGAWADSNGHTDLAAYAHKEAGTKAPKKPDGEVTSPAHLAKAQRAGKVAELLAKADEWRENMTGPDGGIEFSPGAEHSLRDLGRRNSVPAANVDALVAALKTGERRKVDAELDRIAEANGLTRVGGQAGDVVTFDRGRHKPIGPVRDGEKVTIVKPAYTAEIDGKDQLVSQAVVEAAHVPATPAKKATPRKAATPKAAEVSGTDALKAAPYGFGGGNAELDTALGDYAGSGYAQINQDLRSGRTDNPATARTIATLDEGMRSSELTQGIKVGRGLKNPAGIFGAAWNDTDVTGLTWTDQGFASVTADPARIQSGRSFFSGQDGASLTVLVPKGTPALAIGTRDSGSFGEKEMLLDRGLTYRVVRDHGVVEGIRKLDVEVVPNDSPGKATPRKAATPSGSPLIGDAALKAAAANPTGAQLAAVDRYGGDGGYVINNDLRAQSGDLASLQPKNRATVEAMDSLMHDSPLQRDVVVHHKTSLARNPFSTSTTGEIDPLDRDLTGFSWTEHTYTSTSIDDQQLKHRGIDLRITVPAGTPAISHKTLDNGEILLPRGSTFRVTADHGKDDRFVRHLDVEVVPKTTPRKAATPKPGKATPASDVLARLNTVASADEATAYLGSLDLSREQLLQLAEDLDVPLRTRTKSGVINDIVKVRVSGRLMTEAIQTTKFGDGAATPKVHPLGSAKSFTPTELPKPGKATLADIRPDTRPGFHPTAQTDQQVLDRHQQRVQKALEITKGMSTKDAKARLDAAVDLDFSPAEINSVLNQRILADIRQATSRTDAEALLKPHLKSELQAIADEAHISYTSRMTKPTLTAMILDEVHRDTSTPVDTSNPDNPARPSGPNIEVASDMKDLTSRQIAQGDHLTAAGRKALDSLGPAGHPRIAAIPDTEGKVREAYRMLVIPGRYSQDDSAALEDVRKLIGDQVPRAELDAELKRMHNLPDVLLTPQSYARENSATRIPAAVMMGGQEYNMLHIADPSLAQPSQFAAVAMAEELDNRKAGLPTDPMMANLSDADLRAEIDRRAARDPIVARDLAAQGYVAQATGQAALDAVETTGTKAERDRALRAVEVYRGPDYGQINLMLRGEDTSRRGGGAAYATKLQPVIDDINGGIAASTLTRPVVAYRGVSGVTFGLSRDPATWPTDLSGREWDEAAFASTSADRPTAERFGSALLRIVLPEGSHALPVSGADDESELLLPHGSRFRVVADHGEVPREGPNGGTIRLLDVEVIPPTARSVEEILADNPDLDTLSRDMIWNLVDGGETVEDTIQGLIEDGIAEAQAREYVREILDLIRQPGRWSPTAGG